MIGDKASDMEAAVSAKISNTILLMDTHNTNEPLENAKYVINEIVEAKKIITYWWKITQVKFSISFATEEIWLTSISLIE